MVRYGRQIKYFLGTYDSRSQNVGQKQMKQYANFRTFLTFSTFWINKGKCWDAPDFSAANLYFILTDQQRSEKLTKQWIEEFG